MPLTILSSGISKKRQQGTKGSCDSTCPRLFFKDLRANSFRFNLKAVSAGGERRAQVSWLRVIRTWHVLAIRWRNCSWSFIPCYLKTLILLHSCLLSSSWQWVIQHGKQVAAKTEPLTPGIHSGCTATSWPVCNSAMCLSSSESQTSQNSLRSLLRRGSYRPRVRRSKTRYFSAYLPLGVFIYSAETALSLHN